MQHGEVIQQPPGGAKRLHLLFHGVGARPDSMQPLARAIADFEPAAAVVCVRAPQRSDVGFGWQWFSVRGITEASRPARVATALPGFVECVRHWQFHFAVPPGACVLTGFSQGALMILEASQVAAGLAGRLVAIGGRFATPPHRAPDGAVVNVLHGEEDPVMACERAVQACEQLLALGVEATLDLFPGLGHEIDGRVTARLIERLSGAIE